MIDPTPAAALRWSCDEGALEFETTAEVEPLPGVVGQGAAVEALRFGLESDAPGQNVFVRGLTGTGRMTLVGQLLEELRPRCPLKHDRCYVHNFSRVDHPRLVTLPSGEARAFRRELHGLADFILEGLPSALEAESVTARRRALEERTQASLKAATSPFEEALREADLQLVNLQLGQATQTAIYPLVDGEAVSPEEFEARHERGEVSPERHAKWLGSLEDFGRRLEEISKQARALQRDMANAIRELYANTARAVLEEACGAVRERFKGEDVDTFLNEVVEDVVEQRLSAAAGSLPNPHDAYGVNIVAERQDDGDCAIVVESTPTLANLLGSVDRSWGGSGPLPSDYRSIRGGSILRADGGYLVLDARDLLSEPGAWKVLVRTLRTGLLEVVPPELGSPLFGQSLKPEAIPTRLRVVLVGDAQTYYLLDSADPDFGHLFKVLADFDSDVSRDQRGLQQYSGVLARIAGEEGLPAFHRSAVAALCEHGARIAARKGRLTARFARVADIAREGAYLARRDGHDQVSREHIHEAVRRTRSRADLPSRRFQTLLAEDTIHVQTAGETVGQINGLAVLQAGPLTFGFPARITASIGPGTAGVIDIESHASLSGSIHTKGFQILRGLLRHLLSADHPLAFSASLAFEQSYGGIDGDSASGAEICCLLSALTGAPIRQSMAMTGAIDQHGRIQAIGGVNEKIEGFFDTCKHAGLSGDQGVLIPHANAGDLMLRQDVLDACAEGLFRVWAVSSIHEALELLTGLPPGERDADGDYPEESLLGRAVERAHEFWLKTVRGPMREPEEAEGGDPPGEDEAAQVDEPTSDAG